MTKEMLLDQVKKAATVLRAQGAREVYLFGSLAREDWHADSDVDLAVEGLPPHVFFAATARAADMTDRPLDVISLDQPTPFTRHLRVSGELHRVG